MSARNQLIINTIVSGVIAATTGCGGAGVPATAVEHTISLAALDSLPVITVDTGARLCLASGYDACPLERAVANPISADRIVLWEPNRTVMVWSRGDTTGEPIGAAGTGPNEYRTALAVRANGDGYQIVAIESGKQVLLDLDGEGSITDRTPLPNHDGQVITGFVGNQPVRQQFTGWNSPDGGHLEVILLDEPTDSSGEVLLDAPVKWMKRGSPERPQYPPLVTATPSWAMSTGGTFYWSPGSSFTVESRNSDGEAIWRLDGPTGSAVTGAELDAREAAIKERAKLMPFATLDYDRLRSESDSLAPMIAGLVARPDGGVLVAGFTGVNDSTRHYYLIDSDGLATGQFALDTDIRVLMMTGDSLLVHRPTSGELREVRWLVLGR